jgi:tRNA A58 N-methylase Trm61
MPGILTNITRWSHVAVSEALQPGDLAVDLTVGNGKDTLFLFKSVGPGGCVVGFDIQTDALKNAAELLRSEGADVNLHMEDPVQEYPASGVHLILADHARWPDFVNGSPKAVIANLGYLPGADHGVVTQIPTTVAALETALDKISLGGRLAVVCYVEHTGGREEAEAVEELFKRAEKGRFRILRMGNFLTENAPFLLVAEKIRES